jgi:hypothetical protein
MGDESHTEPNSEDIKVATLKYQTEQQWLNQEGASGGKDIAAAYNAFPLEKFIEMEAKSRKFHKKSPLDINIFKFQLTLLVVKVLNGPDFASKDSYRRHVQKRGKAQELKEEEKERKRREMEKAKDNQRNRKKKREEENEENEMPARKKGRGK